MQHLHPEFKYLAVDIGCTKVYLTMKELLQLQPPTALGLVATCTSTGPINFIAQRPELPCGNSLMKTKITAQN